MVRKFGFFVAAFVAVAGTAVAADGQPLRPLRDAGSSVSVGDSNSVRGSTQVVSVWSAHVKSVNTTNLARPL